MNAVRIHKYGGGPKDLVYEEDIMQPHPKECEVLVKVYATGVTLNEIVWFCSQACLDSFDVINGSALESICQTAKLICELYVFRVVTGHAITETDLSSSSADFKVGRSSLGLPI